MLLDAKHSRPSYSECPGSSLIASNLEVIETVSRWSPSGETPSCSCIMQEGLRIICVWTAKNNKIQQIVDMTLL